MIMGAPSEHPTLDTCHVAERSLPNRGHGQSKVGRTAILFSEGEPAAFDALQGALHRLNLLDPADRTVVSDTLALASKGDVRLAREILDRLSVGIDFFDTGHLAGSHDQAVERGMWRTAQFLSRTDHGFDLLQALQPAGTLPGRASRIILQVSDHCLPRTNRDPAPHAFCKFIEGDSVQRLGMPAAVRRAAYRMLDPEAVLTPGERALIFAWEQGFREDGPGTALHAVKHRIAKFSHKSISRVEAARWRSFIPRLCGGKKSPLTAMQMGMHGAQLSTLEIEHARAGTATSAASSASVRPKPIRGFQRRPREWRLSRPDRCEAGQLLDRLITRMQPSSRVRFADGARRGLSLQGLTIGLSNFLHTAGVPLGLRLNLSRHLSKRSVLEIGYATGGGEIMFGKETRRQNTIGAGIIAGYDFNTGAARLRCGLAVDLARTREARRASGVILRVARRQRVDGKGHDDERMKTGMRRVMRFLFEESTCKEDSAPDAVFTRFADRFFDDPDVSVGGSDADTTSRELTAGLSASLTANVAATGLRFGPAAGVTATRASTRQYGAADVGGRLQGSSFRNGAQTDIALTAGINGKVGGNASDVGLLNASLMQLTIPLHRHGQHLKARLIRERGRLTPGACTLDCEFTHVDDYEKAVADEAALSTPPDAANWERRSVPAGWSADAVGAHLSSARHYARSNQTFVIRKRLKPNVARAIDRNTETAETIRACTHLSLAQRRHWSGQLDADASALLARADSWELPELRVMERSARARRNGLLSAGQLATESQAEGERCLARLVLRSPA